MATTLFFWTHAVAKPEASTHLGTNNTKLNGATSWWLPHRMGTTRGDSATTIATTLPAGPTSGIEVNGSGTQAEEWFSEPLSADFTISGTITLNLWGFEAANSNNAAINCAIDKVAATGGTLTRIATSVRVTELATSNAVNNFTVTPTSTACNRGDRLRFRVFFDDAGTMGAGTGTFSFNGPTASVAGDSFVTFTETLTFETTAPTGSTYYLTSAQTQLGTAPTLVSDFTGADENPLSEGGNWGRLNTTLNQLKRASNAATAVVNSAFNWSYWTPANFGPDLEAWVTASAFAGITQFGIAFRIQGEGGADTWDGYRVVSNGAADMIISRETDDIPATIGSGTLPSNWASGDKLGVRCVGSGIQGWRLPNGSSTWQLICSATDATYGSAGKIALLSQSTSIALDDFYAGTNTNFFLPRASTSRGGGSVNAVTNTATGPTAGIQTTAGAGGTALEWYTAALEAVTLGGMAKFNIRALESSISANASLKAEVAITANDGSGAAIWAAACMDTSTPASAINGEIAVTTDTAFTVWVAGDDTSVPAGQRLRFRIYVDDMATFPLATGFTVTVSYNGTSAAAAGDTYVILPVAVTEQTTAAVIPDVGMALTVT